VPLPLEGRGLLLGLGLFFFGLSACVRQARDQQDPSTIATVNGEALSRAEFEQDLSRDLPPLENDAAPSPEQIDPMKRALLDMMIERTLLLQAARSSNVTVSPEEVDRGVLRISSDYPAENFNEALAQGQLSMAELKQRTAALLTVEKLFRQQVYPRVAVTEEEIRRHYSEHAVDFSEPEEVHAAQIVVKGLDEAKRLQAQLKSGQKFADLAKKYSLSADAKVGGDLGFFPRGVMPPQFDEVAFRLGVGQISDVVATDYGFHLFRVLERRAGRKKELSEVRGEVEQRLLDEKRREAQKEYVKVLREKAQVQVNEPVLLAVTGKPNRSAASGAAEP